MISGVTFFFMGDVSFINYDSTIFFIIGMCAFVVGKILYMTVFFGKLSKDIERLLPFLAIMLLYCTVILYYLTDGAGSLTIPLYVYSAISMTMAVASYLRFKKVNVESYAMVFMGSLFFVASDTISGFDKFYAPMLLSNSLILLFFGTGHYLIIRGILAEVNEESRPSFFKDFYAEEEMSENTIDGKSDDYTY